MAIGELGVAAGLIGKAALVRPLTSADYPTPAQRPSYSLLDCTGGRRWGRCLPLLARDQGEIADQVAQLAFE